MTKGTKGTLLHAALLGAVLLGCAGPRNPTGGSMAGTKGTSTGEPNGPVGLCMFNPADAQVRRCLYFGFGRCEAFGDICTKEEYDAQAKLRTGEAGRTANRAQ